MEITKEFIKEINSVYSRLEYKKAEIVHALLGGSFEIESGWYNGHYNQGEDGSWQRDAYPIPVVGVKALCDIEIEFNKVTVTTKLRRKQALEYSFDQFMGYSFEVYGVEEYLTDFYTEGLNLQDMKINIQKSKEKDIGFSFSFPFDTNGEVLFEFVKLIRQEGFYY